MAATVTEIVVRQLEAHYTDDIRFTASGVARDAEEAGYIGGPLWRELGVEFLVHLWRLTRDEGGGHPRTPVTLPHTPVTAVIPGTER